MLGLNIFTSYWLTAGSPWALCLKGLADKKIPGMGVGGERVPVEEEERRKVVCFRLYKRAGTGPHCNSTTLTSYGHSREKGGELAAYALPGKSISPLWPFGLFPPSAPGHHLELHMVERELAFPSYFSRDSTGIFVPNVGLGQGLSRFHGIAAEAEVS